MNKGQESFPLLSFVRSNNVSYKKIDVVCMNHYIIIYILSFANSNPPQRLTLMLPYRCVYYNNSLPCIYPPFLLLCMCFFQTPNALSSNSICTMFSRNISWQKLKEYYLHNQSKYPRPPICRTWELPEWWKIPLSIFLLASSGKKDKRWNISNVKIKYYKGKQILTRFSGNIPRRINLHG